MVGYCPSQLEGDLTTAWNTSTVGGVGTSQRGCHLSANSLINARGLRDKSENQGLELSQVAWANMARSGEKRVMLMTYRNPIFLGRTQYKVCVENRKFLPDMSSLW